MRLSGWNAVACVLVVTGSLSDQQPARAMDTLTAEDLQIVITKKGLGKEVVITRGPREWFMMVDVTPENTVVLRQEKDGDRYLLDESETHDRPLTAGEVDAAVTDYVNSVKARANPK